MDIKNGIWANRRYIFFFAGAALVLWALYTWRMVLLPFMLGLMMAYLLTPLVRLLERIMPGKRGTKRVLSIFVLLFSILGVFAFAMFIFITSMLHSSGQLMANASQYINNFIAKGKEWTATLRNMFPASMRGYVDNAVQSVANSLTSGLQNSTKGGSPITSVLGVIFGFAAVPLFLFYLLKDSEMAVKGVCSMFGDGASGHAHKILCVVESVIGRYVRAQIMLSSVLFGLTLVGLLVIGVNPLFAFPLAFVYGLGELIPTLGAWIAGAIMVIVVLATQPDKLIAVIIMDLIVKLLENMVLVPRIQASNMRMHPTVVLVLLVLGGHFWGLWGMILTVPVAATLVDVFKYVRTADHAEKEAASQKAAPVEERARAADEKIPALESPASSLEGI